MGIVVVMTLSLAVIGAPLIPRKFAAVAIV
jgi:hypothetical protein